MEKLTIIFLTTSGVLILTLIIWSFFKQYGKIFYSSASSGNIKNLSLNQQNNINLDNLTLPNSQDIWIKINENVTLYGVLSLPNDVSQDHPLIIIAPGSGPTDHNVPCSYYYLAKNLQEQNIATFRYDKRLIGKSIPANQEILQYLAQNTFFSDYISDYGSIVTYFVNTYKFPQIYLLGHSQGSLVVIQTASTTKEPIKGVISLAGAGQNIADVLKYQLHNQLECYPQLDALAIQIIDKLQQGQTTPIDQVPKELSSLFGSIFIQKYLINWMQYEPTEIIKTITYPVQMIQGTADTQVTVQQAQMLEAACKQGIDMICILDIIENMNHVLKHVTTSDQNLQSYYNPNLPLDTDLIPTIQEFITQINNLEIN